MRRLVSLLIAAGLVVGMLGAGVGAAFVAQVTAVENVNVGTFGCTISSTQAATVGDTVTYTAPDIMSSAPGSAPFDFTVTSTGSIPVVVSVSATVPAAPFLDILGAQPAVKLAGVGVAHTYNAGLQWPELVTPGVTASITYTASCNEDRSSVSFSSGPALDSNLYLPTHEWGSGFNPGSPVTVSFTYAWGTKGYVYSDQTTTDGNGNFSWNGEENCLDSLTNPVYQTTDQAVIVTATDGAHSATGTGTLLCSLHPNYP